MPLPHAVTRQNLQAFPVVSFSREKLTTATTRNICGVKELPGKTMRIISVHRQRESRRVWTFPTIQMRCRGLLNKLESGGFICNYQASGMIYYFSL